MAHDTSNTSRRRFIRIVASGLAAAPLAGALFSHNAQATNAVGESDPIAVALKYKIDATESPDRKDKAAVCSNCSLYSGKSGAVDGPCSVFAGRMVNAKGWCTGWVKKA